MNIAITGAAGFIGSKLGDYFEKKGHSVYRIVRSPNNKEKCFTCNIEQGINLDANIDVIIHAASANPNSGACIEDYIIGNIDTTRKVLRYVLKQGIKKIIYFGAVSSYGKIKGELNGSSYHIEPEEYGLTKFLAQKLISNSGISNRILIMPGVIGRNCNTNWILNTTRKLYKNEFVSIYNSEGMFNNIVSVDDVCKFVVSLCERGFEGSQTYLLSAKDVIIVRDLIEKIKNKLGSLSKVEYDGKNDQGFYIDSKDAVAAGFLSKSIDELIDEICDEVIRREKGGEVI